MADEIAPLRVSPYDLDPEQVLRLFVPKAHEIDQENDPRLWYLAEHLAEALSVHTHATYLMEKDPEWDFTAIYYRPLDEICHRFMAYHPPRMEGVPERDFELYRDVVNSTYRFYDLLLRRLLHFAGPDGAVMVVSDHGFHSDHLRPEFTPNVPAGITIWHRPQGIFAARGPGIRADELVFGARLLKCRCHEGKNANSPTVGCWSLELIAFWHLFSGLTHKSTDDRRLCCGWIGGCWA